MVKLRVSYGTNGNRSLKDTYLALSNLSNGGVMGYYNSDGSAAVIQALEISRLGNPNLEWERLPLITWVLISPYWTAASPVAWNGTTKDA